MPESEVVQTITHPEQDLRNQLLQTLREIAAWDQLEAEHLAAATEWVLSGAPLWRIQKPDIPPMHLVSYFVVLDEEQEKILLVAHRKAGLWLPSGGHVEPGEYPWETVLRECREELDTEAIPSDITAENPLFLTINRTQGHGQHQDVSLWYVLNLKSHSISAYDREEFKEIGWFSLEEILNQPIDTLDRHMHRFIHKLKTKLSARTIDCGRSAEDMGVHADPSHESE